MIVRYDEDAEKLTLRTTAMSIPAHIRLPLDLGTASEAPRGMADRSRPASKRAWIAISSVSITAWTAAR